MPEKIILSPYIADARAIAARYQKRIEPTVEGIFVGCSRDFPGVAVDADSEAECLSLLSRALSTAVALMLHRGQHPPTPLIDAQEDASEQINVRVSVREKLLVAEEAERTRTTQSEVIRAALRAHLPLINRSNG